MNNVTKETIQYRIDTLTEHVTQRERSIRSEQEMINDLEETKQVITQLKEDLAPHLPQRLPGVTTVLRDKFYTNTMRCDNIQENWPNDLQCILAENHNGNHKGKIQDGYEEW